MSRTGETAAAAMADTIHLTTSAAETRDLARTLAATLVAGDLVLLHGELGAGKTVFVKGLADGLGLDAAEVTSPTFTLVHEYAGGRLPLTHLDLYRLERTDLDDVLDPEAASRGAVVVEWAERLRHVPPGAVVVEIRDAGGDRREIRVGRPGPAGQPSTRP